MEPQLRMKQSGLKIAQVYGSRVLVKTVKPFTIVNQAERSGIVMPQSVKDAADEALPSTGIVSEVGDYVMGTTMPKVGDMLMFSKYAGTTFVIDQVEYRILDIKEVMCKLEAHEGTTYDVE